MPRFKKPTRIQTVIVNRRKGLSQKEAKSLVTKAGFDFMKIDVTPKTYRFRQEPPSVFNPKTFRTINFKPGLSAVIGVPKY